MQHTTKVVVKGAGFFVGEVEGTKHDTGQLFIEEEFSRTKPNYKGFRTVEYKCLDSTIVQPLMHMPFPITAEVTFEMNATKRGSEVVVLMCRPIDVAKPMPKAA